MLSLLLLYFIWKTFADLAVKHDKSKWGFGILGVVMYYAGTFIAGIVMGVVSPEFVESGSTLAIGLMAIPFGIAACFIFYFTLKKVWGKNQATLYNEIENIGQHVQEEGDPLNPGSEDTTVVRKN